MRQLTGFLAFVLISSVDLWIHGYRCLSLIDHALCYQKGILFN